MLSQLPTPPPDKNCWPWTEESELLSPYQSDGTLWPRISIITPSFNQGEFIEETIRSIVLQNYPNLEYIIIDGGSSDNTINIIRKYNPWIAYWISEPDRSQSHAINKGFDKCTGEWVNWVCSDDMLCKNALSNIAPILTKNLNTLIIGKGFRVDQNSKIINEIIPSSINNINNLIDIKNYWRKSDSIMQQSCIYPVEGAKKSGYLKEKNHYTMDYDLWGRLLISEIPVLRSNIDIGIFRWYGRQKTSNFNKVTNSLIKTALSLILINKKFSVFTKTVMIFNVLVYWGLYYYHSLRSKIGIKSKIKYFQSGNSGNLHK